MHIISASRQTDLPAFYTGWLIQRIREGFCYWTHPYTKQSYSLSLKPEDCLAFVFWTRNPAPLLPYLDELDALGHHYYFIFTLLGYPPPIETHVPKVSEAVRTFKRLAERISPERVIWKYDPIVFSSLTPLAYHVDRFGEIAESLAGATERCSYAWYLPLGYAHSPPGLHFRNPTPSERLSLLQHMLAITRANGMQLSTCFNRDYLLVPEIQPGSCIDMQLLRRITSRPDLDLVSAPELSRSLRAMQKEKSMIRAVRSLGSQAKNMLLGPTPSPCRCVGSYDIGSPNTCLGGCSYCFATQSLEAARQNYRAHNPSGAFLLQPQDLPEPGSERPFQELPVLTVKKGP